jgi:hypothetical protein
MSGINGPVSTSGQVYDSLAIVKQTVRNLRAEFPTVFLANVTKAAGLERMGMLDKLAIVDTDGAQKVVTVADMWNKTVSNLTQTFHDTYGTAVPPVQDKTELIHTLFAEAVRRGVGLNNAAGDDDDDDDADGEEEEVYQPVMAMEAAPAPAVIAAPRAPAPRAPARRAQAPAQLAVVAAPPIDEVAPATREQLMRLKKIDLVTMCRDAKRDVPRGGLGGLAKNMLTHALLYCSHPPTVQEVATVLMA